MKRGARRLLAQGDDGDFSSFRFGLEEVAPGEAQRSGEKDAREGRDRLVVVEDARVEVLLLEPTAERPAWRCPRCGRASADGGKCPLDDTKLAERPDAADLAIHQSLLHGGTVLQVGQGTLGEADGIAALLRF